MYLTLDSALGSGSAAVCSGGKVLAFQEIPEKGAQAKRLVSTIEQVLNEAGIDYANLSQIVCTVGPGGFTGIRIALATARAIGFSAHKPVKGMSTLACLAYGFKKPCLAILPAGKGTVYAQAFAENFKPEVDGALLAVAELQHIKLPIITASVSEIYDLDVVMIAEKIDLNASLLAQMAMDAATAHLFLPPEPLYIRSPDISKPAA